MYEVTEDDGARMTADHPPAGIIAAWPPAWQGQNLRDILVTLGYDGHALARAAEERPPVDSVYGGTAHRPRHAGFTPAETTWRCAARWSRATRARSRP